MPELHITSTLIGAETRATAAAPATPATGEGAGDAGGFAALLAGQLDPAATLVAPAATDEESERPDAPAEDVQSQQADATAQLLAALGMPQEALKDPARSAPAAVAASAGEAIGPPEAKPARGRAEAPRERPASEAALAAVDRQGAQKLAEALQPVQRLEFDAAGGAFAQVEPRLEGVAMAAPEARPAQAGHHAASLPGPVGTAHWREAFGSSVTLFATQRVQSAELHVQPPELGPVQVSIRIEANEASIALVAPHAETRQALEDALPRLREMLEAGGLAVGNTSVGDSGPFERDAQQPARRAADDSTGGATAPTRAPVLARADQLIDVFA